VLGWIGVSNAQPGVLDVFARIGKWALVRVLRLQLRVRVRVSLAYLVAEWGGAI